MTHDEHNYRERSRRLYEAAEAETKDRELALALYAQSERIAMKALALELQRKQFTLTVLGIPLRA